MKKYNIKCIENKTKQVFEEFTELSNTKKFLQKKYDAKFRFTYPECKVIIERLFKKPGKQIDIFDIINE